MRKKVAWMVVAAGLLLLVVALTAPAVAEGEQQNLDGKTLFMDGKCNMCHSVPAAGIEAKMKVEKMKGPDITGKLGVSVEEFGKYLRKQSQINGKNHGKEFKGSDAELRALYDWFASLEK